MSWVNFLEWEKLPCDDEVLQYLCAVLAEKGMPKFQPYQKRIETRKLICLTAIEVGIDLTKFKKRNGKMAMGRGLLDVWNTTYQEIFNSNYGTAGAKEIIRRDIKCKLRGRLI